MQKIQHKKLSCPKCQVSYEVNIVPNRPFSSKCPICSSHGAPA